jgi:hypothetical protein
MVPLAPIDGSLDLPACLGARAAAPSRRFLRDVRTGQGTATEAPQFGMWPMDPQKRARQGTARGWVDAYPQRSTARRPGAVGE